ncbi:CLIP domain-containing serine protease B15-like [Anopheles cruzii]|uniref:CLIP domain-containing serine protease B15-like n=1 Tax=Anopheles cruzii TaxID=68878 RepID=UPI0022EC8823|nr:CLIP domain-containing serine protease B15-like [Anopheles cruzii]
MRLSALIALWSSLSLADGWWCTTLSRTNGLCVPLAGCSRWKQISDKNYISREETNLLRSASRACSTAGHFCCALTDLLQTTPNKQSSVQLTTTTIRSTTRPEAETFAPVAVDRTVPHGECFQDWLPEDARHGGRYAENAAFGVFVAGTTAQGKRGRCVGSLITPEYVLTAAHCAKELENLVLYVNAHNLSDDGQQFRGNVRPSFVEETIIHENYTKTSAGYDIALLRLNGSIPMGAPDSPWPICIPLAQEEVASVGHTLRSFGWGLNAEGQPSDTKQWVTVERISLKQCRDILTGTSLAGPQLDERSICTVSITGHDVFAGYSGGPLMYRKRGVWFVVGLVSFGVGRTNNLYPVVSTNVQQYGEWILDKIRSRSGPGRVAASGQWWK